MKKIILLTCVSFSFLCFMNLAIAEETAEYFRNLGDSYKEQDENSKALEAYKKAIFLEPNMAEAHSGLGSIHARLKEYDKAIEELELAIEIKPELSIEIIHKLIVLYLFKNDLKAAKYFKKLTNISSRAAFAIAPHIFNARTYGINELEDGFVIVIVVPFVDLPKGKVRDKFLKADSFINAKEYIKGIESYQEIIDTENLLPEEKAVIMYTIGMIYMTGMGETHKSLHYLKQAIEAYPNERNFWVGLIDAYRSIGNNDAVLEELENFLKIFPSDKYGLYFRGLAYFKLQKYYEAVKSWAKLKEIDEILFALVEDYYNHANPEAIETLERLANKHSGPREVVLKAGITLKPDGFTEEEGSIFMFFKGNRIGENEFEDLIVIPLNEIESINGKLIE